MANRTSTFLDGLSFSSQLHHMLSYVTGSSDDTRIMDDFCTLLFKDSDKLSDPKCLSGNPSQLKMFMMVLNRYNKETKILCRKSLDILRVHHLPKYLVDDLPTYILVLNKVIKLYKSEDHIKSFVSICLETLQSKEPVEVAEVINAFIKRGDFDVESKHCIFSPAFSLMKDGCMEILSFTSPGPLHQTRCAIPYGFIYSRMLWISLALKFYNQDNEDFAMSLWKDNLLDYSAQVSLEGQAIWEIERGLKLGSKLEVCTASSFNHHRMASFAVGVTSMRQFAVVTHYIETIEDYIPDNQKLLEFLTAVFKKYSAWLEQSSMAEVCAKSMLGTVDGAISESLDLVKCIYDVGVKRELCPDVLELECCNWILMFIRMVDFTNDHAKLHLQKFLSNEPVALQMESVKKKVVEYMHNCVLSSLQSLTVRQFGALFTLGIFSTSLVEQFLRYYNFPKNDFVNNADWIIFLNEIISRCQGARNHSFLVTELYIKRAKQYNLGGHHEFLLADLMEIAVKVHGLFAVEEENCEQESSKPTPSLEFKEFVRRNIDIDSLKCVISAKLDFFENSVESNDCEQLILTAVHDYIVESEISEGLLSLVKDAVNYVCEAETLTDVSVKQKFCFTCIVACCSMMPQSSLNNRLFIIQPLVRDIMMQVGRVNYCYCMKKRLTDKEGFMTKAGQQQLCMDLYRCPVTEIKRYFEWVHKLQEALNELNEKLLLNEITFNVLTECAKQSEFLRRLCRTMCVCSLLTESEIIEQMQTKCYDFLTELKKMLIKGIPGQPADQAFTLQDLLEDCHVAIPCELQKMISKCLILPLKRHDHQSQQISVEVSEGISINEIALLKNELVKFDSLIDEHLITMLAFFRFHKCQLFYQCLNRHLADTPTPHASLRVKRKENEMDLSIECFVKALESVFNQISKLLKGEAEYSEIMELHPQGLDIPKEVKLLESCSTVFSMECSGLTDTANLLNLCKVSHQARDLVFVCRQLKIEDARLHEIETRVEELEDERVKKTMTSEKAERQTDEMRDLLYFKQNTAVAPQCLILLSGLKMCGSDALIQLIKNSEKILQVSEHIQSEASVAEDVSKLIKLVNPVLKTNKDLESLMLHEFTEEEMEHGVQILHKINANFSMVQRLFSEESSAFGREERHSAAKAKEENLRLSEENASYKSKFEEVDKERLKLQKMVDRLTNENKVHKRMNDKLQSENQELQNNQCELRLENQSLKNEIESCQEAVKAALDEVILERDESAVHKQNPSLHHQVQSLVSNYRQICIAQEESVRFGIEPWKIARERVKSGGIIGGGGWGAVIEGELRVAIKQFYPAILSPPNVVRLKREMEMLARIRHPNLLQFIGVVFEERVNYYYGNPPYIITELLDMSLRQAYQQNAVKKGNLRSIFQDTARALDYLHRRHEPIIHRDVSSANVLLKRESNGSWTAKVSDLGSANLAKEAFTKNEGAVIYCAPEAFTDGDDTRSAESLTSKVDVYSYGVMLCEVATKTLPVKDVFPSLLERVEQEWPKLHRLVIDCIQQEPDDRPSMEQVLSRLKLDTFTEH